jgi:molecular chaperone DnaK
VKKELSATMQAEINLPFITSDDSGPKHLSYSLSRSKLEELVAEQIDESMDHVKQVVKDAGYEVSDIDEIILVGGQTRMPKIQEEVKKLFGKEANKEINPDEVVAMGAAVQGGIMAGDMKEVLLLDVTPLSLGIETLGSVNTILISKNTTIPAQKKQVFSTAADNQTSVEINVLQGERPMAGDCKSLGRFILDGIPPSPRGMPQIEVSFDIDANGILNVSAKDKATGKEQSIRIEAQSGLSDEEIEKLKKEAEAYKEEDEKKRKEIEERNKAEALLYTSEKTLKDMGDKFDNNTKKEIEGKIEDLKKALKENKTEEIQKKSKELSETLQKIGAQMYQQQQKQQPPKKEKKEDEKKDKDKDKDKDVEEGDYKKK